mmetsp:Transcript_7412/g.8518  ORF Transcript_7412/g.8518 Transcript_7412/m.8518 type:complete len:80 (+) Transcript_7412:139-378(+)
MKQTVLDKLEVDEKGSHVSLASSNPVFDDQSKTKTQIMHDGTGKKSRLVCLYSSESSIACFLCYLCVNRFVCLVRFAIR